MYKCGGSPHNVTVPQHGGPVDLHLGVNSQMHTVLRSISTQGTDIFLYLMRLGSLLHKQISPHLRSLRLSQHLFEYPFDPYTNLSKIVNHLVKKPVYNK